MSHNPLARIRYGHNIEDQDRLMIDQSDYEFLGISLSFDVPEIIVNTLKGA